MMSRTQQKNSPKLLKGHIISVPNRLPGLQAIQDRISEIIQEVTYTEFNLTDLDLRFKEDLGLDSLDIVELVMCCEREFFINLPDKAISKTQTPAELVKLIYEFSRK